jgi:carboxyl-terminal processing protease
MRVARLKFAALWVAVVLLGLSLLAACGEASPVVDTGLPPTTAPAPATTTTSPLLTATPGGVPLPTTRVPINTDLLNPTAVIAPTPTPQFQVPVVQGQPTVSIPPTMPPPTPTAQPTALPATPTPTPRGTNEILDRAAELKVIKSAYEAINEHLYTEPDNKAIMTAAIGEIVVITGVSIPVINFTGNKAGDWQLFEYNYNLILDAKKGFQYPKNQLAFRVVNVMADAVGDEHTYFLDRTGYENRQNLLSGNNTSVGFGIVIITQDDRAIITRVVGGSPAEKSGVKPGDQLIGYGNQTINAKNWSIIRSAKENETHTFTLKRLNVAQPVKLQVTKMRYNLPTVEYRMVNNHIGYIAVRDFFLNVADETDRAMQELRKQGADSWIIDLRENPGGVNVELMTGRFVKGGEIMGYNSSRRGKEEMKVSNDLSAGPNKGKVFEPSLPMTVLIDEGSASSSEMFALAARDFKLGPLIGTRTAGALGHTAAYPVGDKVAISVTVDDIVVERTVQDLANGNDPQLQAGVEYLEKLLAKK